MRINKAYLNCLPREEAKMMWLKRLWQTDFFTKEAFELIESSMALGRVTAHTVYAKRSVPHYNSSAMDGIAVRAQNTFGAQENEPKHLKLLEIGVPFEQGSCYKVDTGDMLPPGTNAVIMIEDVQINGTTAEIIAAAAPWQHVRIIGEDIAAHELVLTEHRIITPMDLAALLAAGIEQLEVVKKPQVAIIPTGDEIVATNREVRPGTILDVNSHMLAAAVSEWGGTPERIPIVRDDRQAINQIIRQALQTHDMVIVNAGTSAGTEDHTADVLAELGEVLVHGIAIKPGKPVVLSICQGKPVIGLPGYPVSTMLTAELFVRDILLTKQKLPVPEPAMATAHLVRPLPSAIGVEEYIRVTVGNIQGRLVAAPLTRGAGVMSSLIKAQGIVRVSQNSAGMNTETAVPIILLRKEDPIHTILAVGSHDLAVELLGVFLRRRLPNVSLACANVGSMGGMMAIRNNEAHIAGIHMLDAESGQYNTPFVSKFLSGSDNQLVHLAMRQQGLMVLPGNPKSIVELGDLSRAGITFINRQRGSGTRMLLDYELKRQGISSTALDGYEMEVATHMAVAASIASGGVDAGLGVQAAAKAIGLDFIPIAPEQYDLLLNFAVGDERLTVILDILKSAEFRQEVEALGGYDLSRAGQILFGE